LIPAVFCVFPGRKAVPNGSQRGLLFPIK